jgi:hypothetical protein
METKHNEHANMAASLVNDAQSFETGQRILQRPGDSRCLKRGPEECRSQDSIDIIAHNEIGSSDSDKFRRIPRTRMPRDEDNWIRQR